MVVRPLLPHSYPNIPTSRAPSISTEPRNLISIEQQLRDRKCELLQHCGCLLTYSGVVEDIWVGPRNLHEWLVGIILHLST